MEDATHMQAAADVAYNYEEGPSTHYKVNERRNACVKPAPHCDPRRSCLSLPASFGKFIVNLSRYLCHCQYTCGPSA